MKAKLQDSDLDTDDEAKAFYDIVCFKNQLRAIDELDWSEYLQIVCGSLLPFAFATYCFSTPHLSVFGEVGLLVCVWNIFHRYDTRAKKREAVLVQCLQALISEASARGAFLGGARMEID